ncbi:MlaD family protein [Flavobacterium sp.]|uniref:MlaD family protein n=1 Tax=Flavobacterium sp. TaxID=239 RepID=UPI00260F72D7|nr:MlaD family protein [Flavobacterium sp.]
MENSSGFKIKLGAFVVFGILIFVVAMYLVGENKNLFGSTFELKSHFKNVSGLREGNNVRFSGITIGTVKNIEFVSDSNVVVFMTIKEDVRQYIKIDAKASIGSDGLMGDKILTIAPGSNSNKVVTDRMTIASKPTAGMDEMMDGFKKSVDNAAIITNELAVFTKSMNNPNGAISKLMNDPKFSNNVQSIMNNVDRFTQKMNNKNNVLSKLVDDEKLGNKIDSTITGIGETVEAAQHNILLRGYINKKKKAETKKKQQAAKEAAAKKETELPGKEK